MEIIKKREIWNKKVQEHFQDSRDVYFNYDYFSMYANFYDVIPEGLYWEDKYIKIFWTHFLRDLKKYELFKDTCFFDLTTPYGYGGPLIYQKTKNIDEVKKSIKDFLKIYKKYALENNYVSEFIRFHPINKNWRFFKDLFDVLYVNDVVILDLAQNDEIIWNNISKNTRRYITKAVKEFPKEIIIEDPSSNEIESFQSLYNKTMDIQRATKKYYFSTDFIKGHFRFGNSLIYRKNEDDIIGSIGIFLKGERIMHYHLGATNYEYKSSPLRAVLWSAIIWAKKIGLKWFHFGGGRGVNDSLFEFKKGFSNTILPFYIGKLIFNYEGYNKLNSLNPLSKENLEFFPQYRVGLDIDIV